MGITDTYDIPGFSVVVVVMSETEAASLLIDLGSTDVLFDTIQLSQTDLMKSIWRVTRVEYSLAVTLAHIKCNHPSHPSDWRAFT